MTGSPLQRYAPAILSFLVLVIGGLQAAVATGPVTWVVVAQLAVLIVTTATTYLVPLAPTRWRGVAKTGLELLGVVLVLVIPYIAAGRISSAEILLVVVAVIKAVGTELGVQLRTDPVVATQAGNVFNITTLGRDEAVDVAGKLADRTAGPDHRAE